MHLFHAITEEVMDSMAGLKADGQISSETFDFLMSALAAKIVGMAGLAFHFATGAGTSPHT